MDETAELAAFRAEVREFPLTRCPPEIRAVADFEWGDRHRQAARLAAAA
ncbi:MAG TPA: hypothetical protein VE684_14895 [Crenalkalicoccus sp.]|jgi:hypothetical protein|nr:hypothetical protein [Crenalkalicoccus sp.]